MAAGTVRKRQTKAGPRWQAIVDLGADPLTGRRRQRSRFCDTERDAKRALAKLQTEADAGLLGQRATQTVGDLCAHWLDTYARFKAPRTYEQYECDLRLHVLPHLGAVKAHALTPQVVRGWVAQQRTAGVSVHVMREALGRLRAALAIAVADRVLHANAAAGIRVPGAGADTWSHERGTWTADEARRFLDVAAQPGHAPYGPVFLLSLSTGMRLGELLGLRWCDVALDGSDQKLHLRHAMVDGRGGPHLGPLKSKSARRDVLIPPPVVASLRSHRAQQAAWRLRLGPAWTEGDLVFATHTGRPIRRQNIWSHYRRLVAMAGVPPIRMHDHRHTHITWALEEHADIKAVAARVGHSNTRITAEIYQRVTAGLERDVVDKTAAKLFPVPAAEQLSSSSAVAALQESASPVSDPRRGAKGRPHRVLRPKLRPRRHAQAR